jgi:hypothetical protein
MSEQANTTNEAAEHEETRCRWGSKSDNPCWRDVATEDVPGEADVPLRLREEHRIATECGREAEELGMNLDALHEFLGEWMDKVEEAQEGGWRIREILYRQRDDMQRKYLEVLVKSEAACRVASRGPDEEPLNLGEVERVMAQMIRTDALSNALGILEELPEESYGRTADRWAIAAVIGSIERRPDEEAEAARRRLSAEARRARR